MDTNKTHYQVLDIPPTATAADIRQAYHLKSLALHPDRTKTQSSTPFFTRIQHAYTILSDPKQRTIYDLTLRRIITDHIPLSEMQPSPDGHLYPCRCGGMFILLVDNILLTTDTVVECDTCSLAIRVFPISTMSAAVTHSS